VPTEPLSSHRVHGEKAPAVDAGASCGYGPPATEDPYGFAVKLSVASVTEFAPLK